MIDFTSPRAIWLELQDAKADVARLEAVLEQIANPSTVSGMHDQDRAPKLQRIARASLTLSSQEQS